ncbi:CLC_0170 family protein [Clostridium sp. UBA6640]|uniref:CLC_0170 family protein n=1 Tax=Clostridium sp. UBA6640 TaxID=1946370 RepID=UPI0025C51203|nr:CLC_0170 family protein [Clostridium sp. UBA6640]
MKILENFDIYILILCILNGGIVAFVDTDYFKNNNEMKAYKEAKYIGIGLMVFAVSVYLIRMLYKL